MDTPPWTRTVELLISELDVTGPCCSCRAKDGILRCSRCKAVSYCGQDCQKKGWKKHKETCNEINQLRQGTEAALDKLAILFGGTAGLLDSSLVKEGLLEFNSWSFTAEYAMARWVLATAYAKCGEEMSSRLALRLAAENFVDLLYLSRKRAFSHTIAMVDNMHKAWSWMVAGDMDQLALNYICYITRQQNAPNLLPLDLSIDEDIEGDSYITAVRETDVEMWFHTFMLISLIKFKKLQALLVEGRKEEAQWNAFMEASEVFIRLGGVHLVTEKLKGFVVDQSTNKRVDMLAKQINGLLETVNKRNPKLIPGVLDRQTLEDPTFPDWDEYSESDCHEEDFFYFRDEYEEYGIEEKVAFRNIHSARFAANNYGHAWNINREYARALRIFIDTGNVMADEKHAGNVMADEKHAGNVLDEEQDTGDVMAEDQDTGIVMAKDKDAGSVVAEEKDAGNVVAKDQDTGTVMAQEKDTGNVMAKDQDTGDVMAEEDTRL